MSSIDGSKIREVKEERPNFDRYALELCLMVSRRATCRHRSQGAVIVKDQRVLATGYNGAAPGIKDCLERGFCQKSEGLSCLAEGLHGESNAIASAARLGIPIKDAKMYCTFSPCRACSNLIKAAGIIEVCYMFVYDGFPSGPEYLKSLGVQVTKIEWEDSNAR